MFTITVVLAGRVEGSQISLVLRAGLATVLVDGVAKASGRLTKAEPELHTMIETAAGSRALSVRANPRATSPADNFVLTWGGERVELQVIEAHRYFVTAAWARSLYFLSFLLFTLLLTPLLQSVRYFGAASGTPRALVALAVITPVLIIWLLVPFRAWRSRDGV